MNLITVIRNPDPLTEWKWRFWYYEQRHALVLDWYGTSVRPTKRHKFNVSESYSRLDNRHHGLSESDVILYPDVIEEARNKFIEGLRVARWTEVGGR